MWRKTSKGRMGEMTQMAPVWNGAWNMSHEIGSMEFLVCKHGKVRYKLVHIVPFPLPVIHSWECVVMFY